MHHDSFCCNEYKSIAFPTQRLGAEYIAETVFYSAPLPETCPEKCRPKIHPDWTRC